MSHRVSVIIPVYNMEEYIEKGLRSVLGQTWRDLELVVVDDGSTDQTGEICDRIAAQDDRVRVIHRKNGGVSAARNTGLDAAQGELIAWLDGDDWMEPEAIEKLVGAIDRSGADMALCNYENVQRNGRREIRYRSSDNEVITGREALNRQLKREITQSLCFNLAPRAFYAGIRFPEGELFEDVRSSYRLYEQSMKVALVNDSLLFNRLVRNESISHVKNVSMRAKSCAAYLIRQRDLNRRRPESEKVFVRYNYASLLLLLRAAVLRDSEESFRAEEERIRDVCGYFRKHTRTAMEGASPLKRLDYYLLTQGTRRGFWLSRVLGLLNKGGTWVR